MRVNRVVSSFVPCTIPSVRRPWAARKQQEQRRARVASMCWVRSAGQTSRPNIWAMRITTGLLAVSVPYIASDGRGRARRVGRPAKATRCRSPGGLGRRGRVGRGRVPPRASPRVRNTNWLTDVTPCPGTRPSASAKPTADLSTPSLRAPSECDTTRRTRAAVRRRYASPRVPARACATSHHGAHACTVCAQARLTSAHALRGPLGRSGASDAHDA